MGLLDYLREAVASVALNTPRERLCANVRRNAAKRLPLVQEIPPHGKVAILVGGGPSLINDIDEIRARQQNGQIVFAQNGAAGYLLSHGITADYQVIVDARRKTPRLVCPEVIHHLICSHCDHKTVERSRPSVTLFHPNAEGIEEHILPASEAPCQLIGGSQTVGLVNMALALAMGYRSMHLFGYDSSLKTTRFGDMDVAQHHAYPQAQTSREKDQTEVFCAGKRFITTPILLAQAQDFAKLAVLMLQADVTIAVHGAGLLPTVAKMMLQSSRPTGPLHIEYPLITHPASWNFLEWLMGVEVYRVANGYSSLVVSIKDSPTFRNADFNIREERKREIVDNVCRPLITMIGATVGDGKDAQSGQTFPYTMKPVVDAFRAGQLLPVLVPNHEARGWAMIYRGAHVITLREAEYWPARNSNLPAWLAFARQLRADGARVVFVRDTAKAHEPLEDFETCPEASLSVDRRLALYRACSMNYMVSNGPATLAMYSVGIPYVCFMKNDGELRLHTDKWFRMHEGIGVDEQWPWATEHQRLVWQEDTFENIMAAIDVDEPAESPAQRKTA